MNLSVSWLCCTIGSYGFTLNFTTDQPSITDGKSKLKVFNTLGKIIYEENLQALKGENSFEINGRDFAEGMYIYSVEYNGKSLTKKMVISSN